MLGVAIDISEVAQEFSLTREEMKSFSTFVVEVVSNKFRKEWETQAKEGLHQTRNQYINSIYSESISENTKAVGLVGQFPNMIEQGCPAFDMKEDRVYHTTRPLYLDPIMKGWELSGEKGEFRF